MKEIGSEFCEQYAPKSVAHQDNTAYLLSGRTALHFIIDDIKGTQKGSKVLMPAYCCESMILPFLHSGITVQFYEVNPDYAEYPYENDADIVFLLDYFGYETAQNRVIAEREKQAGKTVIYDATHKINGHAEVQRYADYTFCSYRKWFFCNYAEAVKHNGVFEDVPERKRNERYLALRLEAAEEKAKYLSGEIRAKEGFLTEFRLAEEMLDDDYVGYVGQPVDCDFCAIIAKRRENALYLMKGLKEIPEIRLWRDTLQIEDAPLFVPILVAPDVRGALRQRLINERIYCPIHWPKSVYYRGQNALYDTELSLICDQRYDTVDMERLLRVIKDFFER